MSYLKLEVYQVGTTATWIFSTKTFVIDTQMSLFKTTSNQEGQNHCHIQHDTKPHTNFDQETNLMKVVSLEL